MSACARAMKYFPDEPADSVLARSAVIAVPLFYLAVALIYSAHSAPWGRQVDPESAYAMNGLVAAAGYHFMKSDHPGTTTILLVDVIVRVWAFVAGRSDVVEFGLKNYDAVIYAARTAEALILSVALTAGGFIVRNTTRSAIAAVLFQVAPFVNADALHFETVLIPESLMVSCAILGMAFAVKAALDRDPPSVTLGATSGLIFGLGLSSKYLHLPLAMIAVSLLGNWRAFLMALLSGVLSFAIFNRIFNPLVFSGGFHWLVSLATHKGVYGTGEPGFIDFDVFWPDMGQIIAAAPLGCALFVAGALAAFVQMVKSRRYFDPIGVTLVAAFLAFLAQLVATSKHFALHYMMASWALTGGVLVLTIVEVRRLFPQSSPRLLAACGATVCAVMVSTTLLEITREAVDWTARNSAGAQLSQAVSEAGPSCANVSGMFVRAPENELNHGAEMAFGLPEIVDRFADAYNRVFKAPLLNHQASNVLYKNFHPYRYTTLAGEYPCIVVRTYWKLDAKSSKELFDLNPEHCSVDDVQIYTVGIPCAKIRQAFQSK
jgi:hypothetical protein